MLIGRPFRVRAIGLAVAVAGCLAGVAVSAPAGAGPAAGSAAAAPVAVACTPPPAAPVPLTSAAQVAQLLAGTWIRCDGSPGWPVVAGERGLEIDADGHWYRVYDDPAGGLVRAEGPEQDGRWSLADGASVGEPGRFELWLEALGAQRGAQVTVFAAPGGLLLDAPVNGIASTYVRWTGPAPVPGVAPGTGPCGRPTGRVLPTDTAQAATLLAGVWIRCDGVSPFGGADAGLQFDADGRVRRVYAASGGAYTVAEGLDEEAKWTLSAAGNAVIGYQLDIRDGVYDRPASVYFYGTPAFVRFSTPSGGGDYLRWSGPAPVAADPPGAPGPCGRPKVRAATATEVAVRGILVGTWIRCAGPPALGEAAGAVGVVVAADLQAAAVARDGSGALVRTDDPATQLSVVDTSAMNGPGRFQIDATDASGRNRSGLVQFWTTPRLMRLGGVEGVTDYLFSSEVVAAPPTTGTAAPDTTEPEVLPASTLPPTGGAPSGAGGAAAGLLLVGIVLLAAGRRSPRRR